MTIGPFNLDENSFSAEPLSGPIRANEGTAMIAICVQKRVRSRTRMPIGFSIALDRCHLLEIIANVGTRRPGTRRLPISTIRNCPTDTMEYPG
jgi:hypothetical protein